MVQWLCALFVCLAIPLSADTPPHVYKIVTPLDWDQAKKTGKVPLSDMDKKSGFIHLAGDGQVEGIVNKYWQDVPMIVILKLDTSKLEGRLVKEKNPGGNTLYYHLYNGSIPVEAVMLSVDLPGPRSQ